MVEENSVLWARPDRPFSLDFSAVHCRRGIDEEWQTQAENERRNGTREAMRTAIGRLQFHFFSIDPESIRNSDDCIVGFAASMLYCWTALQTMSMHSR
jgi:hypothetical protein